ncbi:hypothetical protein Cenrod_1618 [Candidatus Symbiobacter mobilis CR]|uniref:Uncharacterized protein n=1 Tax=Candidatus Symbiobacter mobilis CR TaxID=946483 RepID=U5NBT1_9BURK|nr:hypothetical protein Cenrod_1618 [Candidatus Symbiobacter mobilis CR]
MFVFGGFAEIRLGMRSNYCADCQWIPGQSKETPWSDAVIPGREFHSVGTTFTQIHPELAAWYPLGRGYKLGAVISQRWRNGEIDVPNMGSSWTGYWYKKLIALNHDDFGKWQIGHMMTQAWSRSDAMGNDSSLSGPLSATGAGYGMLTNAIRYTAPTVDVAKGTMTLEFTYDRGNRNFKVHTPHFLEVYGQYKQGNWLFEGIYQTTRNGTPTAWGQGPFRGLTPFNADGNNPDLVEASQGITMLMARYELDKATELMGAVRRNTWSGVDAVAVTTNPAGWNNMFNVDWSDVTYADGKKFPGYGANSVDLMLGFKHVSGRWTTMGGLVYLGAASTDNPSERGQSNSSLVGGFGMEYDLGNKVKLTFQTGAVHYARLGLTPMSLGSNEGLNYSDSRITRDSNWYTAGVVWGF